MPIHDHRRLIFDLDAIRLFLQQDGKVSQKLKLFPNRLSKVSLHPESRTVSIGYFPEVREGDAVVKNIGITEIAAILIEHCIRLNIPIPRESNKQVTVEDNCIVVSFVKRIEIDH
jgi:hypothetical protein